MRISARLPDGSIAQTFVAPEGLVVDDVMAEEDEESEEETRASDDESIILFDVPCSEALFEHLARTNGDSLFGAIFATSSSWSEREGFCDLILNHRLMGNHLDPDELNLAIVAIGVVVDEFRKEYHEAFGGIPVNDVDIFGDEDEGEDES